MRQALEMTGEIKALLTALLEGVSRKELESRAQKLSSVYRGGGTSTQMSDQMDGLAYLVTRFPATYAAAFAAFSRAAATMADFSPESVLDVGAGPGTAALAAKTL